MYKTSSVRGFTLIELLVSMAVMAVLLSAAAYSFSGSLAQKRDAERKSDLRILQNAIELYKQKNGRYPEGCRGANNWSGGTKPSSACSGGGPYILGLAPEFIPSLPYDPRAKGNEGYVYVTNADGSVYKLMAMNTVETEKVHYCSEFASCDIRNDSLYTMSASALDDFSGCADLGPNGSNRYTYRVNPSTASGAIDPTANGYCAVVDTNSHPTFETVSTVPRCYMSEGSFNDGGTGRFEKSFSVWGGIHPNSSDPDQETGSNKVGALYDTTQILCK